MGGRRGGGGADRERKNTHTSSCRQRNLHLLEHLPLCLYNSSFVSTRKRNKFSSVMLTQPDSVSKFVDTR